IRDPLVTGVQTCALPICIFLTQRLREHPGLLVTMIQLDYCRTKTLLQGSPIPKARRSKRIATKERANLVFDRSGRQKMFPCLIVDRKSTRLNSSHEWISY